MTPANARMKEFLKQHGITCQPKYLEKGSQKGSWVLYGKGQIWYGNQQLQDKLTALGFTYYAGGPLTDLAGNGGAFHVTVKHPQTASFLKGQDA